MTGQSEVVVVSVKLNMELVLVRELFHHLIDVIHSLFTLSHGLGREVSVAAGAVPVGEQLGGDGDINAVVLSYALEQVASHVEMVSDLNT